MAGSVLSAVRSALVAEIVTALEAAEEFDTEARFSWRSDWLARERIYTHAGRMRHDPASLHAGPTKRKETGEFDVYVDVMLPGQDVQTAIDRAFELGVVVEATVAAQKSSLPVTGLMWLRMGDVELAAEGQVDQGSGARVRYAVMFEARLT